MKNRIILHKPDALVLLVLLVTLGMLFSTWADAGDDLFSSENLHRLVNDGDLQLAPLGKNGNLQMSLKSPSQEDHALYVSQVSGPMTLDHGIRLSVKLPW